MIKIMINLWLMMVCLTTNIYGLSIATIGEPSGPVEPAPLIPQSPCVYQGVIYPEGDFKPDPCTFCTCDAMGEYVCRMMSCAYPECAKPVVPEGQCCPVCEPVSSCQYGGKEYPVGEFKPSPCEFCTCTDTGLAFCAVMDCAPPLCHNPVQSKDKCCPTCPDEPEPVLGCKVYDGSMIPHGESATLKDGSTCHCSETGTEVSCVGPPLINYPEPPPLVLPERSPPPPTTTEPELGCKVHDGSMIPPGESATLKDGSTCHCSEMGTEVSCVGPPLINYPEPPPLVISDRSPPPPTKTEPEMGCKVHDGSMIPPGESATLKDGSTCHCSETGTEVSCVGPPLINYPEPPPPPPATTGSQADQRRKRRRRRRRRRRLIRAQARANSNN